jgi:glycosyltransferase involved in cell wall biosynthesis
LAFGILTLSRNYGYESALVAGLNFTNFDVYSLVDADGEDPVEMLPKFLDEIISGEDLVLGIRRVRHESKFTQVFRRLSYLFLSKVSDEPFIPNSGNFSMFRKSVRNAILTENKVYPFLRATLSRVGFSPKRITHDRNPRIDGKSKHRHLTLYRFAILGFMTSTTWPLRVISYFSAIFVLLSVTNFLLLKHISVGVWNEFIDFQALFNLLLLVFISIIGLYLARIYKYTIGRPLYYVDWSKSYEVNAFQFQKYELNLND